MNKEVIPEVIIPHNIYWNGKIYIGSDKMIPRLHNLLTYGKEYNKYLEDLPIIEVVNAPLKGRGQIYNKVEEGVDYKMKDNKAVLFNNK